MRVTIFTPKINKIKPTIVIQMNLENKIYASIFTLKTSYRYTLYIDWHGNMSKIQGFFGAIG